MKSYGLLVGLIVAALVVSLCSLGLALQVSRNGFETENGKLRDQLTELGAKLEELKGIVAHQGDEAYSGVPLGAMIPYFGAGKEAPKGYVWADGQTNWPDEDWVPAKLRDRSGENKGKVPNMSEQLVGGAKDEAGVGGVFKDGQITVQQFKVGSSAFSVPVTSVRMADHGFIFNWQNSDGWHQEIKTGEADKPIPPSRLDVGPGFFMRFDPVRATYDKPQGTVTGDQTVKDVKSEPLNSAATNPRHLMCRWIIRVK